MSTHHNQHKKSTGNDYLNRLGIQEYNFESYIKNLPNMSLDDHPEVILDYSCLQNYSNDNELMAVNFEVDKELAECFEFDKNMDDLNLFTNVYSKQKEKEECEKRLKSAEGVLRKSREECIKCEEVSQEVRQMVCNIDSDSSRASIRSMPSSISFHRHGSNISLPINNSRRLERNVKITKSMHSIPQVVSTSSGKNVLEYVSTNPPSKLNCTNELKDSIQKIDSNNSIVDQFLVAIKSENFELVSDLLQTDNLLILENKRFDKNNNVLHCAVITGNADIVKLIAERIPNLINLENIDKLTPISLSITIGRVECLDILITYEKQLYVPFFLLQLSVKHGQDGCLRLLLQRFEPNKIQNNLEGINDTNRNTLAHTAAKYGQLSCLQTLVEFGFDVLNENTNGYTPLYLSDFNNQRQCTAYLSLVKTAKDISSKLSNINTVYSECLQNNQNLENLINQLLLISNRNIEENNFVIKTELAANEIIDKYSKLTSDLLQIIRESKQCELPTFNKFSRIAHSLYDDSVKVKQISNLSKTNDHLKYLIKNIQEEINQTQNYCQTLLMNEVISIKDPNIIFQQHLNMVLKHLSSYRVIHPHSNSFRNASENNINQNQIRPNYDYIPTNISNSSTHRLGVRAIIAEPKMKNKDNGINEKLNTKLINIKHDSDTDSGSGRMPNTIENLDQKIDNSYLPDDNSINSINLLNDNLTELSDTDNSEQTLSDGINELDTDNFNCNSEIQNIIKEDYSANYYRTLSTIEEVSVISDVTNKSPIDELMIGYNKSTYEDKPWYEMSDDEVDSHSNKILNSTNKLPTNDHFTLL